MKDFIQIGNLILNKSDICHVRSEVKEPNNNTVYIKTKTGASWTLQNRTTNQLREFEKELMGPPESGKLYAIRNYIEWKPGVMSKVDKHIIGIIERRN